MTMENREKASIVQKLLQYDTSGKLITVQTRVIDLVACCTELVAQIKLKPIHHHESISLINELFGTLKELCRYLSSTEEVDFIGEVLIFTTQAQDGVKKLYQFHSDYFLELGKGLPATVVYSLLYILNVFTIVCDGSKGFCKYLVDSGSLFQNFFELEELKKTLSHDEIATKFLLGNLMVLYSCSHELNFCHYFKQLDPQYFFNSFCTSQRFDVRIHSKFIVGQLIHHIPSIDACLIDLDEKDIEILFDLVGKASFSENFEVHDHECRFTVQEILQGIRTLCNSDKNVKQILLNGFLTVLTGILIGGGMVEKEEALQTLFKLATHDAFVDALESAEVPILDVVTEMKLSDVKNINSLASGVISLLPFSEEHSPEICYKYSHYEECISQCNKLISKQQADFQMKFLHLLKGKSLYHLYHKELLKLKASNLETRDMKMLHGQCFSTARTVINTLAKAELDNEGMHMLDFTLMEYAAETNGLKDIRICLLCQKKADLLRSHMCPHAILKEFCAASTTPENLRVFDTSSHEVGHSKSPKESTMYAFCKKCENMLSTYGEQEFLPKFFRRVYNISDPVKPTEEIYVEYGAWLYHFCIGMLFRVLIKTQITKHSNCDELYDFLLQCRNIILNPPLTSKNTEKSLLPRIFILFGPQKARDADQQYGFMNQVLNDAYFATVQTSSLMDGNFKPPYPAHYAIVHIGIIHIIAMFSPSYYCALPPECQIDPIKGVYKVPPETSRGRDFPKGLWKMLHSFAMLRSKLWLERPLAPLERMQKEKMSKPSESMESIFHISSSVDADLAQFQSNILPSHDPKHPRVVCLLPKGFEFRPVSNPGNILLPKSHKILFHFPKGEKEVFFLAVGHSNTYDISKPYVIYTHCEPGLHFCHGFFINPKTLCFVDFMPFREGKVILNQLAIVEELKSNAQMTIKRMLKAKGVSSLIDVLQLCQMSMEFNFDLCCYGRQLCWYCVNRCFVCMNYAGSAFSKLDQHGKMIRFCSKKCYSKFSRTSSLTAIPYVSNDNRNFKICIEISGTGTILDMPPAVLYHIGLYVYYIANTPSQETDEINEELKISCAFYVCRSLYLQFFSKLTIESQESRNTVALQDTLSRNMTDLLEKCFQGILQNNLTLKQLYSVMCKEKNTQECSSAGYVLDAATVDVIVPCLAINLIDCITEEKGSVFKENSSQIHLAHMNDKKNEAGHLKLNAIELIEVLKFLPGDFAVVTNFCESNVSLVFEANENLSPVNPSINLSSYIFERVLISLLNRMNHYMLKFIVQKDQVDDIFCNLAEIFIKAELCVKKIDMDSRKRIGDEVAKDIPSIVNSVCTLFKSLYCNLNRGLSTSASQCFLSSISVMASLANCSKLLRNSFLTSTAIVHQLMFQLNELKSMLPIDQFMKEVTVFLMKMVNSIAIEVEHHWQFLDEDIVEVLKPYCTSSLPNVALIAKMTLSHFLFVLPDDTIQLLKGLEMDKILKILDVTKQEIVIFGLLCTFGDIFQFFKTIFSFPIYSSFFTQLLREISLILEQDTCAKQKEAVIDFLWTIALTNKDLSDVMFHSDLNAQLLSLTALPPENSLHRLASCVLWELHGEIEEMPKFYPEECYHHGYYKQCISSAKKMLQNLSPTDKQQAEYDNLKMLQGKASFYEYQHMQEKLKRYSFSEKDSWKYHSDCYSIAKRAILCLGSLLDKGLLDEEGSKFLDLSIIDYVYKTNDLQSCGRCLLCRRKDCKLHKSHIWPKSILEEFSSGVEVPVSRSVFQVSWHSPEVMQSPKQITFTMFCGECENLLSSHGESQFVPKFFRQIYDVSNPKSPENAFSIVYQPWLHEFCIGMLFRALAQRGMTKFVNCQEIYEMLKLCRSFLLQLKAGNPGGKAPTVYILIGPTEAEDIDSKSGFINRVLTMPAFLGVEEICLEDGEVTVPRKAQYVLAHIGVINILTKFESSPFIFDSKSQIDPNGGSFPVIENKNRKSLFPLGVWNLFLRLAQDFEVNWLTRPAKAVCQYLKSDKKEPKEEFAKTFGLVSSTKKDFESLEQGIHSPASGQQTKVINFLPKHFRIAHENQKSSLTLPPSHHVILHYTIFSNQETIFLCAGNDDKYSHQKPYIIYHYYRSDGVQFNAGFFINSQNLSAEEYLPGSADLIQIDTAVPLQMLRSYIPKLLPVIVKEKGFCSFNSLYLRLQSSDIISCMDMKCRTPSHCWYCLDRCEFCMEKGCLMLVTSGSIPVSFCSNCQHLYTEKKSELKTKVRPLKPDDPCVPSAVVCLSPSHKMLLYVKCEMTTSVGMPLVMQFTLCSGRTSSDLSLEAPYVSYHHWTPFTQHFLEFTVSKDMIPNEPVPYTDEGDGVQLAVTELRQGPISTILMQSLRIAGIEEL